MRKFAFLFLALAALPSLASAARADDDSPFCEPAGEIVRGVSDVLRTPPLIQPWGSRQADRLEKRYKETCPNTPLPPSGRGAGVAK